MKIANPFKLMTNTHDLDLSREFPKFEEANEAISHRARIRSRETSGAKSFSRNVREFSPAKMFLRPILRLARRFGLYITRDPSWLVYEDHIVRVLSTLKINCVLDVGSYRGDFAKWLRRIGYAGLIISFEPVAANFEILEETSAEDAEWHAHRMALGATKGKAEIRVFTGATFHSFLAPSDYGRARFPDKLQVERTELVPVERLDDILDQLVGDIEDPRIFLKVDTQGYDLEVIRGLGTKAGAISALQVEMAVTPIYDQVTNSFVDALSYLQQLGFQMSGMFPVSYSAQDNIRVVEFDCVMCRADNGKVAVIDESAS
jgi:FkbM family methyltransferase